MAHSPPSSPTLESDPADDIVAYFRSLPADARRDYAALAELDRRFGEDIEAEERARVSAISSGEGDAQK